MVKMTEKPFRLLALDVSASPGFAVIDVKNGKPTLIYAGSVKTDTKYSDSERYAFIEAATIQVIYAEGPFDAVCRERFLKGGSKRATQLVFGSWAMVDSALGKFGYSIADGKAEITNSRVKALVGGRGGASKDEVEEGVRKIFGLPESYVFTSDDASDAAAIGYTYLHDKGVLNIDKSAGKTK